MLLRFGHYANMKRKNHVVLAEMTFGNNLLPAPQDVFNGFRDTFVSVFCSSCDRV